MKNINMFDVKNKTFVITGAYGRIGKKVTNFLVENGAKVIGIGRDKKKLNDMNNIDTYTVDIKKEKEIVDFWANLKKNYSKIHVLINNAGRATNNTFEELSKKEWDEIMDTNLTGIFLMCREGVNSGLISNNSSIINISSIYGIASPDQRIYENSGLNCSSIYAASKGGIIQFTKYLATYLSSKKIRVNCISPGGIFNNQPEAFLKNYVNKTPMGRMGKEEDLFGAIVFLSSENASGYITGENLIIDGGFTVW